MRLPFITILFLLLLFAASKPQAAEQNIEIKVARVTAESWRVDYEFSEPVMGFDFGAPIEAYRMTAWRVETSGVRLLAENGSEKLVSTEKPFRRVSIMVNRYSAFPSDQYVPFANYSDGGASVYLGHFAGDVISDGGLVDFPIHYQVKPLAGERAVLPGPANEGRNLFAYFGPAEAIEKPFARMIVDPEMPAWLGAVFDRTLVEITAEYSKRLGVKIMEKPLIMIAAGELDSVEGFTVKGGALNGQIIQLTLRGTQLHTEDTEVAYMMQRLMAHELAHIWQQLLERGDLSIEDPWIHEGSAEAMALLALNDTGLWPSERLALYRKSYATQCREYLAGTTIAEAVAGGNFNVVYPCGFGVFDSNEQDVFEIWKRMTEVVIKRKTSYSQDLLDELTAPR